MEIVKINTKIVLVLFPIAIFFLLDWIFGFQGLYGQDSYVYLDYTRILTGEYENSQLLVQFLWPKAYPFLGFLLHGIGFSTLFALRLISLVSFILSLFLIREIINRIYKKDSSLFVFIAGAAQIYFLRSSFLVMSDSFALCLTLVALLFFVRYLEKNKFNDFLFLLFFAVLAVYTRYATGVLLVLPCAYAGIEFLKKSTSWMRLSSLLVISLLSIFVLWSNASYLNEIIVHASEWKLRNFFHFMDDNRNGNNYKTVPNLLYVFANFGHIGYLSLGVFLVPFYRRIKKRPIVVLTLSVVVYLLFVGGLAAQNYRFLVLTHAIVLVLLFPAFERFSIYLKSKNMFTFFIISVFLFNLAFGIYSFQKTYKAFYLERTVALKIKEIEKGESIYSFYVDQSFPSYGITNNNYNLYYEEYPSFEKGALVIFNPSKFKKQWEGQTVMKNWDNLAANYKLDTICEFQENWVLYRIK